MTKIILASNSPRRKKILSNLNIKFEIIPSNYEEKLETDVFSYDLIEDLATQKACDVVRRVDNDKIVLGADTVVVLHNKILGKPKDKDDAFKMLKNLSGNTHMVVTSLFNVNQISRYNWNYERPWIRDLKQIKTSRDLKPAGDFSQEIVGRFGLFKGDNVFMYLTKNSQKNIFIPQLIDELDKIFDKIIYILSLFYILFDLRDVILWEMLLRRET